MEKENKFIKSIQDEMEKEAKELKANESIRSTALEALRKKKETKKTPVIPLVFNYKVPLWMVAASVILIVLLLPYTLETNVNEIGNNPQLAVHDTVYVDKIINDTVEIIKPSSPIIQTVYIKESVANEKVDLIKSKDKIIDKKQMNINDLSVYLILDNYTPKIDLSTKTSGKSLSEDAFAKAVLSDIK